MCPSDMRRSMTDEDEESSSKWPRLLDEDKRRRRTSLKLEYLKKIEVNK
jgi:hypothetical protein